MFSERSCGRLQRAFVDAVVDRVGSGNRIRTAPVRPQRDRLQRILYLGTRGALETSQK